MFKTLHQCNYCHFPLGDDEDPTEALGDDNEGNNELDEVGGGINVGTTRSFPDDEKPATIPILVIC